LHGDTGREVDVEGGPVRGDRLEGDGATVGKDDLLRDREAETRAVPFGGFAELEHLDVLRDARTRVRYRDADALVRPASVQRDLAGALVDGFDRVLHQVV